MIKLFIRIPYSIVLLLFPFLDMPWMVGLLFAGVGAIFFPFYVEALIYGMILDALGSYALHPLGMSQMTGTVLGFIVMIVGILIRRNMR